MIEQRYVLTNPFHVITGVFLRPIPTDERNTTMKNTSLKTLLGLVFCCFAAGLPAHAQVGTPKWNFHSRAEVEAATRRYKLNLHQSYNIIMCATRQGMIRSVVHAYEEMMPSNVFDVPPEMASSFALAHRMMMGGNRWDWKLDTTPNITKLSDADSLKVALYRDRALEMLPNSPEVLVSYAIWATGYGEKRPQALHLVEKALRLAPRWADAYYWHYATLEDNWAILPPAQWDRQGPRYGLAMLHALNTAAQLDPWFKRGVDVDRAMAYERLGRPREALTFFDAYTTARPDYAQYWDSRFGTGQFRRRRGALLAQTRKK